MRGMLKLWAIASALVLLPSLAAAQGALARGTLTGTVRDAAGAVLPGVTVEAASPALIEKVRTAVTDSAGVYRIVNLDPGVYTLTFTLEGFSQVKREEAIELHRLGDADDPDRDARRQPHRRPSPSPARARWSTSSPRGARR